MIWYGFAARWKRLGETFVLRSSRSSGSDRARLDVIGTDTGRVGQSDGLPPAAFRPDERARRSEFSLHIGP